MHTRMKPNRICVVNSKNSKNSEGQEQGVKKDEKKKSSHNDRSMTICESSFPLLKPASARLC